MFNEGEADWVDYFILMALGTKTKAWCKKNANNQWTNTIVGRKPRICYALQEGTSEEKGRCNRSIPSRRTQAQNGNYIIHWNQAVIPLVTKLLALKSRDLLEKGLDNLSVIADARSNPHESHVMSIGGMGHTFSVPTSFKADVRRFGGETTMGRGKFIYVQILPKTQVEFTGKHKGTRKQTQYWEQGGTKVGDKTGLAKVFPGGPMQRTLATSSRLAIHKRTGAVVPWLIGIPRADFQAFTDSEGRRTLDQSAAKQKQTLHGLSLNASMASLVTRVVKESRTYLQSRAQTKVSFMTT